DDDVDLGRALRFLGANECTTAGRPPAETRLLRLCPGGGATVHRAGDELLATGEGDGGVRRDELIDWDLDWQAAVACPQARPGRALEATMAEAAEVLSDLRATFAEDTERREEMDALDRELEAGRIEREAKERADPAELYQLIVAAPLIVAI